MRNRRAPLIFNHTHVYILCSRGVSHSTCTGRVHNYILLPLRHHYHCYSISTDRDECADDSHMCHVNATCTNAEGSYSCECQSGYIGNGRNCEGELY